MNQFNPKKLHHSKWTAAQPKNKELHFLVIETVKNEEEVITGVKLEAVMSNNVYKLTLEELKNQQNWLIGWK